jgi:hypothetical protein
MGSGFGRCMVPRGAARVHSNGFRSAIPAKIALNLMQVRVNGATWLLFGTARFRLLSENFLKGPTGALCSPFNEPLSLFRRDLHPLLCRFDGRKAGVLVPRAHVRKGCGDAEGTQCHTSGHFAQGEDRLRRVQDKGWICEGSVEFEGPGQFAGAETDLADPADAPPPDSTGLARRRPSFRRISAVNRSSARCGRSNCSIRTSRRPSTSVSRPRGRGPSPSP